MLGQAALRADDERHTAVDVAVGLRAQGLVYRQRIAVCIEVCLFPGDDDAVKALELLADIRQRGGVFYRGKDAASGLLCRRQRDAAPAFALVAALVFAQAHDGALGQEGDDALDAQLCRLADGLPHAVSLGDALHQREVRQALDGQRGDDAAGDALLVDVGDLYLPSLAALGKACDMLSHLAAAHVDVAQLVGVEGQGDLAVRRQRGLDKEAGQGHVSPITVVRTRILYRFELRVIVTLTSKAQCLR